MAMLEVAVGFVIVLVLALTAYATWRGAPWLPTPTAAIEAAFDAVRLGSSDLVVDIGSGDGRVLRAAARRGAHAIGYELSPFFWALSWLRTRRYRRQVRVALADGFRADLSQASVVFAFLRPPTMPVLADALRRHPARRPCRVLAYAFPFADRDPARVVRAPGYAPVFLYDLSAPVRTAAPHPAVAEGATRVP